MFGPSGPSDQSQQTKRGGENKITVEPIGRTGYLANFFEDIQRPKARKREAIHLRSGKNK